jgi:hypothetical protein
MRTFRFDQLKRRAQDAVLYRFQRGSPFPIEGQFLALLESIANPAGPRKPRAVMAEWEAYALKLIDDWDIRCCMKLVELFPGILPEFYAKQRPVCDYDEKGNWVLVFNDKPEMAP